MASDSTLPRDKNDAHFGVSPGWHSDLDAVKATCNSALLEIWKQQRKAAIREIAEEAAAAVIARLGKAVVEAAGGTVPVDQNALEAAQKAELALSDEWMKGFKAGQAKPHAATDGVAPLSNQPATTPAPSQVAEPISLESVAKVGLKLNRTHVYELGDEFKSTAGEHCVIDSVYMLGDVPRYTVKITDSAGSYGYFGHAQDDVLRNVMMGTWNRIPKSPAPSITDGVAETTLGVTGKDSKDPASAKEKSIRRAVNLLAWIAKMLDAKVVIDRYDVFPTRYRNAAPTSFRDEIESVVRELQPLVDIPTDRDGGETIVSLGQGDCMVNYRGNPVTGKITSETPTQSERPLGTHIDTKA